KFKRRVLIMSKGNMKNLITFSEEEKGIITKLAKQTAYNPKYGVNKSDINYFIYYCQLYGLNPITGDAILQKFGKNPQILTTRDGWIKAASQMPGYVGPPISHPIYEGDEVELLKGGTDIRHVRNTNSDKIVGAYAIMHHEKYHSITQTVDMRDYFNANSGLKNKRRKNVWDMYPSAMIVKIAEVFALRRMFPLGQISTKEEMSIEGDQTPEIESSELMAENKETTTKNNPKSTASTSKKDTSTKKKEESKKQEPTQKDVQESKKEETPSTISEQDVIILDEILQQIVDITGKDREILLNSVNIPVDLTKVENNNFNSTKLALEGLLNKANEKFSSKKEETPKQEQKEEIKKEESEQKETTKQEEQTQNQNTDDTIVLPEEHQPLEFTVGAVENLISNTGNPFKQVVPKNDYGKVFNIGGDQEIIA